MICGETHNDQDEKETQRPVQSEVECRVQSDEINFGDVSFERLISRSVAFQRLSKVVLLVHRALVFRLGGGRTADGLLVDDGRFRNVVEAPGDVEVEVLRSDERPSDRNDGACSESDEVTSQHSVVLEQGIDGNCSVVELSGRDDPSDLIREEEEARSGPVNTTLSSIARTHHGEDEARHSSDGASHTVGLLPGESDGDGNDARSEKRTLRRKGRATSSVLVGG